MAELIQKVYAQSLFDAALEEGNVEKVSEEVAALNGIFKGSPEYLTLLSSPAVTDTEKKELIDATLLGKVERIVYNFMRILADKQRASLFPLIAEEFVTVYRSYHGILPVTAVTAVPMTEAQIERLSAKLSASIGKKVLLENQVDASRIGGVLLKYEGREIDGTVRDSLDNLRKALSHMVV